MPTSAPSELNSIWPNLSQVLDTDALSPAARTFTGALFERPDLPERLAKMALMFRDKKQKQDARLLARAARALVPADFRIRILTEWLDRHEAPLWHFSIIHDEVRNETYAQALNHFVKPGMTVFEIGTGTGILAMLAVRAGASHVYTCERRNEVAAAAQAIIERNGMSDQITVIAKDAYDIQLGVDLPERADLFVAEIVDIGLLGEYVLPLTELARERFLKPAAILLPRHISAIGCLVSGRGHHEKYRMSSAMGFDLTPFNRFTPAVINTGMGGGDLETLSEPETILRFDLTEDALKEASQPLQLKVNRSGSAEAVLRWLHLDFGEGIVYENGPPRRSCWWPLLHILPDPRPVVAGDTVDFEVYHTRSEVFLIP
jgi:hypothetical protein